MNIDYVIKDCFLDYKKRKNITNPIIMYSNLLDMCKNDYALKKEVLLFWKIISKINIFKILLENDIHYGKRKIISLYKENIFFNLNDLEKYTNIVIDCIVQSNICITKKHNLIKKLQIFSQNLIRRFKMKKFITKKEMLRFINYLKKIDCNKLKNINKNSSNEIYNIIGNYIKDEERKYKNIIFREDLFEFLINDYDLEFAEKVIDFIRKGKFNDLKEKNKLNKNFVKWASGVKYLPTREMFINEFSVEYNAFKNKYPYSKMNFEQLKNEIKATIKFNKKIKISSILYLFEISYVQTINVLDALVIEDFLYKNKFGYFKRE